MTDETVTIHAARRDRFSRVWWQYQPGGSWFSDLSGDAESHYPTDEALEAGCGPTRPVRVSTVDPARDAVIEAARAFTRFYDNDDLPDAEAVERIKDAVDRLAGTGPPAAPESPPAAEQATPAPQDTTEAGGRCGSLRAQGDRLEAQGADLQRQLDDLQALAGLSAEQEIRARALDAALRWFDGDDASDEADYVLSVAGRFAAFIRDGSVRNA